MRVARIHWSRCFVAIAALTAVACGGGGGTKPDDVVTLSALSLSPKTVTGGSSATGTVTLSAAATAAGAAVSLSSSDRDAAFPPSSVTVSPGAVSATFNVTTSVTSSSKTATISGSFGGATRSDTLTVSPAAIVPRVVVSGPSGNNTCRLNAGGQTLDCTYDGSTSTGPIVSYAWDYVLGQNTISIPAAAANSVANPGTGACGLFSGQTSGGANTNLEMRVTLKVRDASGQEQSSSPLSVTVIPRGGACGF